MPKDILKDDLFGMILFPTAWKKDHTDRWKSAHEITGKNLENTRQEPVLLDMAKSLTNMATPTPDYAHIEAAHKLFGDSQVDFSTYTDQAARNHLGLHPENLHEIFSHLHGIGSWGNHAEPGMVTAFHKPISPGDLQSIAADVGAWARQPGILTFVPNANGEENLLHARVVTHRPVSSLHPGLVSKITERIASHFGNHSLLPGRHIVPNLNGTTDIIAHGGPLAKLLFSGIFGPQNVRHWPGTGVYFGGKSPSGDEEVTRGPVHLQQRSPAKTGIVVRGVYYAPGKIIPTIEEEKPAAPPPINKQSLLKMIKDRIGQKPVKLES